jgi:nucleoside-diphosphate-sugar epimerase
MRTDTFIVGRDDLLLVTGATGFMGPALVSSLLRHGFRNVRAFARPASHIARLKAVASGYGDAKVEIVRGNLLNPNDCAAAAKDAAVIFHLATGGDKSYPDAFMNSVVTTRNLIEASRHQSSLRRFVNVSSFAVYANAGSKRLDEATPVSAADGDAYTFAKVKQDELVLEYGQRCGLPHVIVRPGSVFGPGKSAITGRVGIDTFGVFLHMGGSNRIPLTYIDNCSDAIVLAGVMPGADGEVFNIVDDDLPSSRQFLRQYKRSVRRFRSIYVPRPVSYLLCRWWEKYSSWSEDQLPPVFNRRRWNSEWKKTRYSNEKLKARLGWAPKVSMQEGLNRYFAACREETQSA